MNEMAEATETTDALALAEERLLAANGLTLEEVSSTLSQVQTHAVDEADVYFQLRHVESWSLEEGIVKSGAFSIEQGVGVRAIAGEKQALAYTDDLRPDSLLEAARAVRAVAALGQERRVDLRRGALAPARYPAVDPVETLPARDKVRLLERLEAKARALDARVEQVMAGLAASWETVLVARSDGLLAADLRPLVRLSLTVILAQDGRRESGSSGMGGRYGLTAFDEAALERLAREAVHQARVNLEARPAPAGVFTVVLGPGWPGVLLHEAVGHGLEGDFNRKGTSAYSGRIGERVAAPGVTVVDDGTLPLRRGSLTLDDEGTPTQPTVLIEDGILVGYMQDRLNARLMGMKPTGNGRRESYAYGPMPRMTNTYMLAGTHDPEEILASVERGIYAVNFGGGQVDITSGKFVFSMSEAYWVEDGKVCYPIKGATLIGSGPEVMQRVAMIGTDLALDPGIGTCGKDGQSVPVGVGQPTLRVEGITVGGTQG